MVAISIYIGNISLNNTGMTVLSYINMVCATLRNSIPKSIVYCQVREAKRSLMDYFFAELGKKEVKMIGSPSFSSLSVFYPPTIVLTHFLNFDSHPRFGFSNLQAKQLASLLNEDPAVMQRRTSLAKRLELYRSAQTEIDAVSWSK